MLLLLQYIEEILTLHKKFTLLYFFSYFQNAIFRKISTMNSIFHAIQPQLRPQSPRPNVPGNLWVMWSAHRSKRVHHILLPTKNRKHPLPYI